MKQYLVQLMSKIIPQIFLAITIGSTLATGTVAGVKMIKANASAPDTVIEQVQPVITEAFPTDDTSDAATNNNPTRTPSATRAPTPGKPLVSTKITTLFPVAGGATAKATTTNQNNAQCVVTLFGSQYNVTTLRSSHPGGDIFVCGTDMSTAYQNAHGSDVSRMQAYRISSNGSTGTTGTSQPNGSQSSFDDDDDEESQEEKSRYENHEEDNEQHKEDEVEKGE